MFLKIKLRQLLLLSFEGTRFGTNPFSLHPLANYIYYDALNSWLPVLKKMKKSGASTEEILDSFVMKATQGICPKKFEKSVLSGNAYKTEDLIDSSILKHVDSLCDGDLDLKTIMIGGIAGIRYRM